MSMYFYAGMARLSAPRKGSNWMGPGDVAQLIQMFRNEVLLAVNAHF